MEKSLVVEAIVILLSRRNINSKSQAANCSQFEMRLQEVRGIEGPTGHIQAHNKRTQCTYEILLSIM
jgi:hypothetical protein